MGKMTTVPEFKKWKIIKRGSKPPDVTHDLLFTCMGCMEESWLPVCGLAMCQTKDSLLFDLTPEKWLPESIRCPHCYRTLTLARED